MKRRVRIAGAVLLSLSAATTGCAGRSPWNPTGKPDLPPPASASKSDSLSTLAKVDGKNNSSFAQPSLNPPAPANNRSSGVAAAFAKTKAALTIKPKVVSAPDPISLSSPAGDIDADLYVASASLHESQGSYAKSDELYRKALAEKPRDLNILIRYARMNDRAGNLAQAADLYRQAIAAHPKEAAAYNDLGLCYARQNQLPEATGALQHAVQLQPESVLYRNNLATVLASAGQNEEALSHLTAVHGPAAGHYNLAYLLHKDGKNQEAASYLQRALEQDPQFMQAQRLLAIIQGPPAGAQPQHAAPTQPVYAAYPQDASPSTPGQLTAASAGAQDWNVARAPETGEWGDAPTPDSLPKLLPPVD